MNLECIDHCTIDEKNVNEQERDGDEIQSIWYWKLVVLNTSFNYAACVHTCTFT